MNRSELDQAWIALNADIDSFSKKVSAWHEEGHLSADVLEFKLRQEREALQAEFNACRSQAALDELQQRFEEMGRDHTRRVQAVGAATDDLTAQMTALRERLEEIQQTAVALGNADLLRQVQAAQSVDALLAKLLAGGSSPE